MQRWKCRTTFPTSYFLLIQKNKEVTKQKRNNYVLRFHQKLPKIEFMLPEKSSELLKIVYNKNCRPGNAEQLSHEQLFGCPINKEVAKQKPNNHARRLHQKLPKTEFRLSQKPAELLKIVYNKNCRPGNSEQLSYNQLFDTPKNNKTTTQKSKTPHPPKLP